MVSHKCTETTRAVTSVAWYNVDPVNVSNTNAVPPHVHEFSRMYSRHFIVSACSKVPPPSAGPRRSTSFVVPQES